MGVSGVESEDSVRLSYDMWVKPESWCDGLQSANPTNTVLRGGLCYIVRNVNVGLRCRRSANVRGPKYHPQRDRFSPD